MNKKVNKEANEKVSSILMVKPNGDSVKIEGVKEGTDSYLKDFIKEKAGIDYLLEENKVTEDNLNEILLALDPKAIYGKLTPVEKAVYDAGDLYIILGIVVSMALNKLYNNNDKLSDADCLDISDMSCDIYNFISDNYVYNQ